MRENSWSWPFEISLNSEALLKGPESFTVPHVLSVGSDESV